MASSMKDGGSVVATHQDEGISSVPLCVDLDGTLVRSDVVWESLLLLLRHNPLQIAWLPLWLLRGRAYLKEKVADAVRIDVAALPYNARLLEHLRQERAAGRRVVLVTASHARPAREVADHLGLFQEVIATADGVNLKGRNKRMELERRFGNRTARAYLKATSALLNGDPVFGLGKASCADQIFSDIPPNPVTCLNDPECEVIIGADKKAEVSMELCCLEVDEEGTLSKHSLSAEGTVFINFDRELMYYGFGWRMVRFLQVNSKEELPLDEPCP